MERLFGNKTDSTKFALGYYKEYVDKNLSPQIQNAIGTFQASRLEFGQGRDDCIEAIHKCFENVPEVPYDIIAWRVGEMNEPNRPYLPATLLKETSKRYDSGEMNIHKIIIKQGSKIFPLRALGAAYGDEETEIIIESSRIKNRISYFEYK